MKTLVNKNNPQIRITAPEIGTGTHGYYYVGGVGYYKDQWTLVEEEPEVDLEKAAESYSENRTGGIILDDEVNAFKAGAEWMQQQLCERDYIKGFNAAVERMEITLQQMKKL